ncbi:MAG: RsmD family RNA methyltransferase [Bacteroidetes bacterium]|nr:RsmD family RNA methyltransferase [Bacteroidota bacterium]
MRIITGKHKGKIIRGKIPPVRPTTDYAKSGLFNYLANLKDFRNITVLDLFAGTGNISYEFAARGAGRVIAVDTDIRCLKFIRKKAAELSFSYIYTVKSDALKFLKHCPFSSDIILADPPYEYPFYTSVHDLVFSKKLLSEKGILVIEHSSKIKLSQLPGFFQERYYGNVHFSYFS